MKREPDSLKCELKLARRTWGNLGGSKSGELRKLLQMYKLSVVLGDLIQLDSHWYVTHSGLLRMASRRRCDGIRTTLQHRLSDPGTNRWVFKAVVYKSSRSKGFVGYGDANPSNTSPLVRGAEMRVAETRAVNRALRKAYGIGLCSVEELGWLTGSPSSAKEPTQTAKFPHSNRSNNGQPRLRDRLCVLIRQFNLDPTLVKAYATDFCGTPTLKEANRELVESFIFQLAAAAKENKDALLGKLNSYAQPAEVRP